jgi:hypothetical protein
MIVVQVNASIYIFALWVYMELLTIGSDIEAKWLNIDIIGI